MSNETLAVLKWLIDHNARTVTHTNGTSTLEIDFDTKDGAKQALIRVASTIRVVERETVIEFWRHLERRP